MRVALEQIAWILAPLLLLGLWLTWKLYAPARNAARARRKGAAGESRAMRLIRAAGYRVIDTQVVSPMNVQIDGEISTTHLRADFLLERNGRLYIADAKSGDKATSPRTAATRRQLLEYALCYNVSGVLLIDTERGRIHDVRFPSLSAPARSSAIALFALALGLALGLLAPLLWS